MLCKLTQFVHEYAQLEQRDAITGVQTRGERTEKSKVFTDHRAAELRLATEYAINDKSHSLLKFYQYTEGQYSFYDRRFLH